MAEGPQAMSTRSSTSSVVSVLCSDTCKPVVKFVNRPSELQSLVRPRAVYPNGSLKAELYATRSFSSSSTLSLSGASLPMVSLAPQESGPNGRWSLHMAPTSPTTHKSPPPHAASSGSVVIPYTDTRTEARSLNPRVQKLSITKQTRRVLDRIQDVDQIRANSELQLGNAQVQSGALPPRHYPGGRSDAVVEPAFLADRVTPSQRSLSAFPASSAGFSPAVDSDITSLDQTVTDSWFSRVQSPSSTSSIPRAMSPVPVLLPFSCALGTATKAVKVDRFPSRQVPSYPDNSLPSGTPVNRELYLYTATADEYGDALFTSPRVWSPDDGRLRGNVRTSRSYTNLKVLRDGSYRGQTGDTDPINYCRSHTTVQNESVRRVQARNLRLSEYFESQRRRRRRNNSATLMSGATPVAGRGMTSPWSSRRKRSTTPAAAATSARDSDSGFLQAPSRKRTEMWRRTNEFNGRKQQYVLDLAGGSDGGALAYDWDHCGVPRFELQSPCVESSHGEADHASSGGCSDGNGISRREKIGSERESSRSRGWAKWLFRACRVHRAAQEKEKGFGDGLKRQNRQ